MKNLVDKYVAETTVESEAGVVAIEYVVVAGAVVVALLAIFSAFGTELTAKLDTIIDSI